MASKLDDLMADYKSHLETHFAGHQIDEDLLRKIAKSLGPSIYNQDASQVSCSSEDELKTVKEKFLAGKHGITDGARADQAIQEVCEQYKGARNKRRVVFYYVLAKKLDLQYA